MLSLPDYVTITRATILVLRVTIPADIYGSGILVEIDGVEVKVLISSDVRGMGTRSQAKTKNGARSGLLKGVKANRPRNTHPLVHDPGGFSKNPSSGSASDEGGSPPILPTSIDLAQSFLQTEPPQERAQLQAAISRSQQLHHSNSSDDGEEELGTGLGTGFSLPGFVANFLKGVGDRLRLEVKNVEIDLDMKIEVSTGVSPVSSYPTSSENVTFRLVIATMSISEALEKEKELPSESGEGGEATKTQYSPQRADLHMSRRITFFNVKGMLLSESSLFALVSQFSGPPSPTATHSSSKPGRKENATTTSSSSSSAALAMSQSTILDGHVETTGSTSGLEASIATSDGERLEDTEINELEERHPQIQDMNHEDYSGASQYSDFGDNNQSLLRQIEEAPEMKPIEDSDTLPRALDFEQPRPLDKGQERSHVSQMSTPTSTPALEARESQSSPEDIFTSIPSSTDNLLAVEPRSLTRAWEQSRHLHTISREEISSGSESSPEPPCRVVGAPSPSDQSNSDSDEDLTQSKIFSHEEAESMYMSAISQHSDKRNPDKPIPGGWEGFSSDGDETSRAYPRTSVVPERPLKTPLPPERDSSVHKGSASLHSKPAGQEHGSHVTADESKEELQHPENPVLPREIAASQTLERLEEDPLVSELINSSGSTHDALRMAKHIVSIESFTIDLPQDMDDSVVGDGTREPWLNAEANSTNHSTSQESGHITERSLPKSPSAEHIPNRHSAQPPPISITVKSLSFLGDMGLTRLMIMIAQHFVALKSRQPASAVSQQEPQHPLKPIKVHLNRLSWNFVDVIRGYTDARAQRPSQGAQPPVIDSDVLLTAAIEDLDILHNMRDRTSRTELSIGKCTFGYASDNIVSFDSTIKMRESIRDILSPVDKDIKVSVVRSQMSSKINVSTLPLRVRLDLARLDETFSWFGGLSSVLGLGNSVISVATVVDTKSKHQQSNTKRVRGVRFQTPGEPKIPQPQSEISQQKVTVRIGGLLFDLQGKESSLRLEGTALKVVSRAEGVGMQLDKLKFSGPHLRQSPEEPAVYAQLGNIRIEYLETPNETDLGRLLALLSPSRDRDDTDDDILLDTLLRQRRQGGVVRITVASIEGMVKRLNEMNHFSVISEELGKLSKVAKYLPEDDRPGILTLALVRDLRVDVQVNSTFGLASITSNNMEVAHVSLPSLILLGISSLQAHHQGQELVGFALPFEETLEQRTPMIMTRYIGDELEPTMKFKLWNVRLEYRISTIMAMMGLTESISGEVVISDMVNSIATLTDRRSSPKLSSQTSSNSDRSSTGTKLLKFDVCIRDSVIALNPRGSQCRGLIVLTRTNITGTFPKSDEIELGGALEIKKASVMVIDDTDNIIFPKHQALSQSPSINAAQVQSLSSMGYVVVSDISAAKISVQTVPSGNEGTKTIDIEVRDELFVLETCADSTQTLQSILNGLKPPMPPSQELKYRTEIVPVEDMLASFSGDAYETVGAGEGEDDFPLGLDEGDMMDDEVPQNLEYVSSFYDPNPASTVDDIANSMLEDDLSSLARPPATREIGDRRLLQSFEEQFEIAPGGESLNFSDDHFGGTSSMGGTAHKWNSDRNTYDLTNESRMRGSPLRLRMRDVHIIWNLFDGYDWQNTRDTISQAVAEVETKAAERLARKDRRKSFEIEEEEDSVIGDFLFNSIYIGIPANQDPKDLTRQVNRNLDDLASEAESYATSTTASGSPSRPGYMPRAKRRKLRLNRSKHHKMTFELKGVSADLVVFPPNTGETQSSIDIRVQELDIFDHVPTSTWKKFATYMHDAGERESGTSMVHIEILNVKPVADLAASEIILKATVLPLRLHVDQDALDFMTRFFEFKAPTAPLHSSPADVPFLQRVEVNSIRVRLDFKPKRVDYAGLRSGHTTEFMNFFILDQADMVLRHVIIYGVSGFDKLGKTLNDVWMPDIKRNQLPGVLAGLAPVRSLVNVGGGVRDLVVVPMREYRKDGRVLRSIQKGALSFAKTTTTELAKLGAKLAIGTQTVLQGAEDYLVPTSPSSQRVEHWESADIDPEEKKHISLYADQPVGVVQGLRGAYRHLERDLVMARDAIVAMPGEVMESGSAGGAARAVLRGAPTVILRPALGVTKAVGQTLLGATNSLDRGERRRVEDVSDRLRVLFCLWDCANCWSRNTRSIRGSRRGSEIVKPR